MNAVFLTQSISLRMFYELMQALREPLQLERVGFFVASRSYFGQFCRAVPDIISGEYDLLKEWEIVEQGFNLKVDMDLIGAYEHRLGDRSLWGAIVADRRLYLGKKCALRQDYRTRFSHSELLGILQASLVDMERWFDQVKPDFVASFICVTLGEYLGYLFARSRGIPFLNLRPTRIKNYVTYAPSVFEPSERISRAYESYRGEGAENRWIREAREYVASVHTGHARYEGVVSPRKKPGKGMAIQRLCSRTARLIRNEYSYRFGRLKDNHDLGVVTPLLYKRLLNPIRARCTHLRLSQGYVRERELSSLNYVFFPLHVEPEVTLLVYSRTCLNQIEVIRNIALSMPVGMTLVVKEHPASVGKRPLSYYSKILSIPNVCLADPGLDSRPLITNARLVATIAGSIGWEAVLRRKPVVVLGHAPYEFLPDSMVRRVADVEQLGRAIRDLLQNYWCQDDAVQSYVAAMMSQSVAVNLYSTLLGRQGVFGADLDSAAPERMKKDVQALAQYTIESLGR